MSTSGLPSAVSIRPLVHGDLPAALTIQAACYPAFLREDAAAFASRIDLPASFCLAATRGGVLVAYLLAHGWPGAAPPPIGTVLTQPHASEVLFIHDLAVSAQGCGTGIGRTLIATAFEQAAHAGLASAELIAVAGAAGYWRTLGFAEPAVSPSLAAKVAGYGPEARWMRRDLGYT